MRQLLEGRPIDSSRCLRCALLAFRDAGKTKERRNATNDEEEDKIAIKFTNFCSEQYETLQITATIKVVNLYY